MCFLVCVALSTALLQFACQPILPSTSLLSPVYAACCLLSMANIHPARGHGIDFVNNGQHVYHHGAQYLGVGQLPCVCLASLGTSRGTLTLAAAWKAAWTAAWPSVLMFDQFPELHTFAFCFLADMCDEVCAMVGNTIVFRQATHGLLIAAAASGFFRAVRGIYAWWPLSTSGTTLMIVLAAMLQPLVAPCQPSKTVVELIDKDATTSALPVDGVWAGAFHIGGFACRTFVGFALAVTAGRMVLPVVLLEDKVPSIAASLSGVKGEGFRRGSQVAGALLMLLPSAMVVLVPAHADVTALALCADRLAVGALSIGAWLALFPAAAASDVNGAAVEPASTCTGAQWALGEVAVRCAEVPQPLMIESPCCVGGVQGLSWHDCALCVDPDGDKAHDFWEAITGGCFRRGGTVCGVGLVTAPGHARGGTRRRRADETDTEERLSIQ